MVVTGLKAMTAGTSAGIRSVLCNWSSGAHIPYDQNPHQIQNWYRVTATKPRVVT